MPRRVRKILAVLTWVLAAVFTACLLLVFIGSSGLWLVVDQPWFYNHSVVKEVIPFIFSASEKIGWDQPKIPAQGKAVLADLAKMKIGIFFDGQLVDEFEIVSKGKPEKPWETPTGTYRVLSKSANHWSSFGSVWMPYSLQFFGNFFIHGWPYYQNGEPVSRGFSGGCIRLETADAKIIFEFAERGTPILVVDDGAKISLNKAERHYYLQDLERAEPVVSAQAYLVADLDNGEIIFSKNATEILPIASITKLMTAVVAAEIINQFASTTVSNDAVSAWGDAGGLQAGEEIALKDLVYPLILESSNDAAEVLLEVSGHQHFIDSMNDRAKAIGLNQTFFADASGGAGGNISTAEEVFKLVQYLFHHKKFVLNISRLTDYSNGAHFWVNNNPNSRLADYLGGKNGQTTVAGQTQVALFSLPLSSISKRNIAIVILKSEDRDGETLALKKYIEENVYFVEEEEGVLNNQIQQTVTATTTLLNKIKKTLYSSELNLGFVGDIMLDRGVKSSVRRNAQGDYSFVFNEAGFLREPDLMFGNLEGPVSDRGENQGSIYSFRMEPVVANTLATAGFDVLSLANNHMFDWGREALGDTISNVRENGMLPVGAGWDATDAEAVKIREVNSAKVAFIALSDFAGGWSGATKNQPGILAASLDNIQRLVVEAKRQADVVVVSLHFGEEYQTQANTRQKELARSAIDAGALIVVGHHPHVAQEIEEYKDGLIAYSLGNFVFDQNFSEETMRGKYLNVTLRNNKIASYDFQDIKINSSFQPSLAE